MKFDCRTYTNPVLLEPRARKQCDNRVGAGCEGVGILSVFWLLPPPPLVRGLSLSQALVWPDVPEIPYFYYGTERDQVKQHAGNYDHAVLKRQKPG